MVSITLVRLRLLAKTLCTSFTLFHLLPWATAASPALQIDGQAADVSSLQLHNNTSTVTAPRPPPGFEVDLGYDTVILSPLAVFLSAIDCMCEFNRRDWDEAFRQNMRMWAIGYTVEVYVETTQGPDGPLPLRTSHAVLGLYRAISAMSANTKFVETMATMSLQRREIGTLRVRRLEKPASDSNSLDTLDSNVPNNANNVATGPSGTVIDPDNPGFLISYAYSGTRINSKDIFLAFLDALALTAQHNVTSSFGSFTATSQSRKCQITISEVPGEYQVSYDYVIQGLRILIWDVFVRLRMFEEMALQFDWKGKKIAEGKVQAVSPSGASTSGVEVAK